MDEAGAHLLGALLEAGVRARVLAAADGNWSSSLSRPRQRVLAQLKAWKTRLLASPRKGSSDATRELASADRISQQMLASIVRAPATTHRTVMRERDLRGMTEARRSPNASTGDRICPLFKPGRPD